jgi:uncharacterized SAM-binding protein YcdF (DUF218 family)
MNELSDLIAIGRGLILPPKSLFVLLLLGLFLRRWLPRTGQKLVVASVLLLYLLSTPAVSNLFVEPLERFAPPLVSTSATEAQAIVVLAAGRLVDAPEYGYSDIPDYIALGRLRYAAKLHRETNLPVLVSGGGGARGREPFAFGMARALRDEFQVPVKWIEPRSSNTAENGAFSAQILKRSGVSRILLVTDAMHMRRSVMAFTRTGLTVVAAPTMFLGFDLTDIRIGDFLPGTEGLRRSYYALYQWLGIAWYGMHYEMPMD